MSAPSHDLVALVDIGSDSTRLLVVQRVGGAVREVERRAVVTRLAEGANVAGRLDLRAMERTQAALHAFLPVIEDIGERHAYLTSAVREADHGHAFAELIGVRFGLQPHVLSGAREAELTYRGVVHACPVDVPAAVIDIGGGSCEMIVAGPERPLFSVSVPVGVVRQRERHLRDDPPSGEQLDALTRDVRRLLREEVPPSLRRYPRRAIAVASAESWLAAARRLLHLNPDADAAAAAPRLTLDLLENGFGRLATLSTKQIEQALGLCNGRARSLTTGCTILMEFLHTFELDEVLLSAGDLLTGASLALAGDPYET